MYRKVTNPLCVLHWCFMPEVPDLKPGGFRQSPRSFDPLPAQVEPLSATSPRPTPPVNPVATTSTLTVPVEPSGRPFRTTPPESQLRRVAFVAGLGLLLFAILGTLTSIIVIPRMEDHLQTEALARLDEAGIEGATVAMSGRTATISGLSGATAEEAEQILDDEWGIRDAKVSEDTDPQPVEEADDTVPPPGTSTAQVESEVAEPATSVPTTLAPPATTLPAPEVDLDEELADIEERFNANPAFAADSAELTDDAETILAEAVDLLTGFPGATVQVEGHTDDEGDGLENLVLSQDRADAVIAFLTDNGIEPERLIAVGFGQNNPIADNDTATGRDQNNRTEFAAVP